MQTPRTSMNPYWCYHHWAVYAVLPKMAQQRINDYVPQHLWTLPEFKDQVRAKLRQYGQIANAPQLVVIDWTRARNLSMCCILGDTVMDRLRARVCREFDIASLQAN